ncbi:hypothetical protein BASA50_008884 [Batrachochytrium salamandrivorans]|uniref:Rab-GAP TBC domain-containing protein n=1 Tax=Batrachochytrium salamandrivorans TaxID=1357716 RepID=A0ABQ8F283_9FUNG|nr:hypothetical protein BASA62_008302 [Batrachochytrium salamandrivorans]KAH6573718.1 hypothetical protein BASA60_005900 [Batrachochytrium salamandrivorans]KAH6590882.1 hypothetical protein BASA50_008884 [Batrachochytrium salamandrivorans]KAH6598742.1 hypothetical protein BASA61_002817 [Batrachochytrium salamandrivorans]KAH9268335.1 hypothetical protein BASA84_000249 [Batrachochytrium salamandrivorans]
MQQESSDNDRNPDPAARICTHRTPADPVTTIPAVPSSQSSTTLQHSPLDHTEPQLPIPAISSLSTASLSQRELSWKNKLWATPGRFPSEVVDPTPSEPQSKRTIPHHGLTIGILGSVRYKKALSIDFESKRDLTITAPSDCIISPKELQKSSPVESLPSTLLCKVPELPEDMETLHIKQNSQAGSRKGVDTKTKEASSPAQIDEEAKMMADIAKLNSLSIRFTKFKTILEQPNVDLEQLRKLSWPGIPEEIRPTAWKLLMGYLPANSDRRDATLIRKRKEYEEYVSQAFSRGNEELDQGLHHQIHIDIQRTNAHMPLYQSPIIQESLERILYVWAIRHPASGYVQGINDLVTCFFQVFLQEAVSGDVEKTDPAQLDQTTLTHVQADTFWCLTKLLDGIQDNYTHKQPGIQRQIFRLKELINRIDSPLHNHLAAQGVEFLQFSFRWMNCMLMREISLRNTIRMWDTYLAEGPDGFSEFHLYVCAAFLVKWSPQLRKFEFQDIMMHLQSPPTAAWTEKDIELLLSEAFMWKSLFHNAPNHLSSYGSGASSAQLQ